MLRPVVRQSVGITPFPECSTEQPRKLFLEIIIKKITFIRKSVMVYWLASPAFTGQNRVQFPVTEALPNVLFLLFGFGSFGSSKPCVFSVGLISTAPLRFLGLVTLMRFDDIEAEAEADRRWMYDLADSVVCDSTDWKGCCKCNQAVCAANTMASAHSRWIMGENRPHVLSILLQYDQDLKSTSESGCQDD